MPNQDTITLHLGEITVPTQVLQELLRRHLLRSLRLSTNGHTAPSPSEPEEPVAPAPASPDGAGAP